jgi:regulator of sirC expression with transglutaminase-like and TPR domain
MPRTRLLVAAATALLLSAGPLPADEPKPAAEKPDRSVEQLADSVRKSIAVILYTGRDGQRHGLGTGFVVAPDGLIATNLHVIGDARPISVELADGKRYEATHVHATDRAADLAVIRIDAKGLPALELGDSDALKQGQPVVAVGNPQGLERSVVGGVVSGRRTIDGESMIQLAIPIEPGNSGGPLLDRQGRVEGVLTLKSAVTANLGFAAPVNALKPLLTRPNPIPMEHWLTIGALDPADWKPVFGARWRQRAGRVQVEGLGSGFGGRSLCLWQRPLPEGPLEVAVTVRLDDEAGAAGLVFHADGGDKHYGFYPTGGQLRLVRFEGPDVFSWKILEQLRSPDYRPGDWNTIKVRLEKDRIVCYVNDHQLLESADAGLTGGQVGLAKFRDTRAEFRNFRVAGKIPPDAVPEDVAGRVGKAVEHIAPGGEPKAEQVDALVPDAPASVTVLRERARLLEQQAEQLRRLALAVHEKRVEAEVAKVLRGKDEDVDLVHAALLVAKLDNDEVDVDAYRKEVERMARDLAASLPKKADDRAKLAALNTYLFQVRGFHGSRGDYYHRSNSYLNEVIDDREGLPITLSVLYIELARRVGLNVVGVALPGHFVVKHVPAKGEPQLIDVFEGGVPLSRADAGKKVEAITGDALTEEHLAAASKRAIVVRMLQNLLGLADRDHDGEATLRYLDAIVAVDPSRFEERWARALLHYRAGQKQAALADVDWLLEHGPKEMDRDRVLELRKLLDRDER